MIQCYPNIGFSYLPSFLSQHEADLLFKHCQTLTWQQEQLKLFGKNITVPRQVIWMADQDCHYAYSGVNHVPCQWSSMIHDIKIRLNQYCQTSFNGVLLNKYQSGQHYMGWHSDDEASLGPKPIIASISIGSTRRFLLKPKQKSDTPTKITLELAHGSLLVMFPPTQQFWQHALPATKKTKSPRINLTFRTIQA
ncbi:MAG: alpha-ketoglutarate-dependent dioxygenase AlkB [Pseudomonadota bacterium]|nr:alpha-ketoglutarate-dependent dioxygenase AlkB [Pseudomonadota bacterium]